MIYNKIKYAKQKTQNKLYSALSIILLFISFGLSVSLVKSRQKLVLIGRNLSEIEKNVENLSMKNNDIEAKITELVAPSSLHQLIKKNDFYATQKKNIEKISNLELAFYAMNRNGTGNTNRMAFDSSLRTKQADALSN